MLPVWDVACVGRTFLSDAVDFDRVGAGVHARPAEPVPQEALTQLQPESVPKRQRPVS